MVMGDIELSTELLVVGGGSAGYGAAFRAADLGLDVTLVDPRGCLGGVCLHEGCIPSKALLHLAQLLLETEHAAIMGIHFSRPRIDVAEVRAWKQRVIDTMTGGLEQLGKRRGLQVIKGSARFEGSTSVRIEAGEVSRVRFRQAIIATGSRPIALPGLEFRAGSRLMSSAEALALVDIPATLLVIGGGYVGLELGLVYAALGSRVTLVEMSDRLLGGVDRDLVQPLQRRLAGLFADIHLQARVEEVREKNDRVEAVLRPQGAAPQRREFERVLVAVGRRPVSDGIGLEHTAVTLTERGCVIVDEQQRTADPQIFAVGDVVGGVMLAHKATREGRVAAEVIAGQSSGFDVRAVPAVVYTDPQIAWCGLTEEQALQAGRPVTVQKFPWKYSGRANTIGATDGFTKLLVDPEDGRILGVGVCGSGAEGLISEGVLAIEMGALAEDLALSLHPHPTLAETEAEAAELFLGSPTHILPKRERKGRP